jgi:nucleoside-diphosphate-sugar epimerase
MAVNVFLTGGTGFIGSHLIELLQARGASIIALVRDPVKAASLERTGIRCLQGDLFSLPPIPEGIDVVFHLAGRTRSFKTADYYTVNHEGTASLFRRLRAGRGRPKVIYLSSLAAAGPSLEGMPVKESDPPHPVTHYGRSKLLGEEEALRFRSEFPLVILRATAVFGPRDRDFLTYFNVINRGILATVRQNRMLSICYARDLAEALCLCPEKEVPSGEIFNIADPDPVSWEEFGRAAARALGKKALRVRVPLGVVAAAAALSELRDRLARNPGIFNRDKYRDLKQAGWIADVGKAARLLSFRTRYPLDRALRETIDWYRAQKWL